MRACHDELSGVADGEGPHLPVVSLQLLDVLKLSHADVSTIDAGEQPFTYLVAVPVLQHAILAYGPEVVTRLRVELSDVVAFERDLHNAVVVREYGAMAVTKVEAPDLDVLVRRACYNQFAVRGDVYAQHWELRGVSRVDDRSRWYERTLWPYSERKNFSVSW